MRNGCVSVPPDRILRAGPVARCQHDFELDQLVPFGFGTLPFGNRQQRLQALPRGDGLWLVHGWAHYLIGMR